MPSRGKKLFARPASARGSADCAVAERGRRKRHAKGCKSGCIHVTVTTLTGESVASGSVPCDNNVSDLKSWVSTECGIPVLCQKLAAGTTVLRDAQKLSPLCRKSDVKMRTLVVSLVQSLEPLKAHLLKTKSRKVKLDNLSIIASLGSKAGAGGISIMSRHALGDDDQYVRIRATCLLHSMVEVVDDSELFGLADLLRQTWRGPAFNNYYSWALEAAKPLRSLAISAFMKCTEVAADESNAVYEVLHDPNSKCEWSVYDDASDWLSKTEAIRIVAGWMRQGDARARASVFEVAGNEAAPKELRCAAVSELQFQEVGDHCATLLAAKLTGRIEDWRSNGVPQSAADTLVALASARMSPEVLELLHRACLEPEHTVDKAAIQCPDCNGAGARCGSAINCFKCNGSGRCEDPAAVRVNVATFQAAARATRVLCHVLAIGDVRVFLELARSCCAQEPCVRLQAWKTMEACNGSLDWHAERGPELILAQVLQHPTEDRNLPHSSPARSEVFKRLREQEAKEFSAALHGDVLHVQLLSVRVRNLEERYLVTGVIGKHVQCNGFYHVSDVHDKPTYRNTHGFRLSMDDEGRWMLHQFGQALYSSPIRGRDKPPEGKWKTAPEGKWKIAPRDDDKYGWPAEYFTQPVPLDRSMCRVQRLPASAEVSGITGTGLLGKRQRTS